MCRKEQINEQKRGKNKQKNKQKDLLNGVMLQTPLSRSWGKGGVLGGERLEWLEDENAGKRGKEQKRVKQSEKLAEERDKCAEKRAQEREKEEEKQAEKKEKRAEQQNKPSQQRVAVGKLDRALSHGKLT
ncbi:hypothetical protein NDU88_009564 [Pleurodeles waltl]|uniref:Uncharacterized protein n=1 Tax=Pleurodeles waltl TaxID=8319 RepID=A0AAV7PZR8_PLEWA|nr:hypothetical protein NDU88_009564 [Pleurodeles waltl]